MAQTAIEYGIFNLLPEGKTIEDMPQALQWLYEYAIQSDYSKKEMERRVEEINRWRQTFFDNGQKCFDIDTYCEVRERVITYGPWIQSESD